MGIYLKINVRICLFPDWSFGTVERAGGYLSTYTYDCMCTHMSVHAESLDQTHNTC